MQTPCWISQSLPAIVAVSDPGLCKERNLHASSLYRLIRGETRSEMHKNHLLSTYKRKDIDQRKEHVRKFPLCGFVAKDVTSWETRRDDGENSPRS